jgi:hypothetical protein
MTSTARSCAPFNENGDQAALLLRAHIEASQAEVRKITLHQVHLARQLGTSPGSCQS